MCNRAAECDAGTSLSLHQRPPLPRHLRLTPVLTLLHPSFSRNHTRHYNSHWRSCLGTAHLTARGENPRLEKSPDEREHAVAKRRSPSRRRVQHCCSLHAQV
jgi:hypothetical protein